MQHPQPDGPAGVDLDPVTLAVLRGRLEQIADEMDATLFRSAFNPIIAEAHDASHGLYDRRTGDTLVQGKQGLPVFVGAMSFAVRMVIEKLARDAERPTPGDVFLFNDPYEGGTHLSDFKLVQPHFHDGELFCWLASVGHWHDVGGNVPGNYNPAATEAFQEGMQIPPVRVLEGGRLRRDIVDVLMANSRLPASLYGDLNGQLNALGIGAERLDALLGEHGGATISAAFAALRVRARLLMRESIRALPDGTYRAEDWLDNDGIVDEPLRIGLDVVVDGDRLVLDFSRTAPACRGPVNVSRSTAIASCYVALKHVFPDVPANAGVLDPVQFVIPEGCLLAATRPRPVGGYTETILRIIDAVFVALSQAAPERLNGCAYGTINALSVAGHRDDGSRFVLFSFFGGGHGGHPDGDGLSHGNAPISMATIPPLEILEAAYPVRFTRWGLRPDSAGPGRQRGGLGAVYELELLAESADAFLFGERGRFAPPGVAGGEPAARNRLLYPDEGGMREPALVSKSVGIRLRRGDRIRLETPGGGGYGAPAERAPARVAEDVRLGYVSPAAARERYRVALDAAGEIDVRETARLRGTGASR